MKAWFCAFAFLALFNPASLWACTVCMGAAGGSWQKGFYWGILLLLLLPVILFSLIGGAVFFHIRKKNRASSQ
jgi:membrane protein DedA with SNARE-associated domain